MSLGLLLCQTTPTLSLTTAPVESWETTMCGTCLYLISLSSELVTVKHYLHKVHHIENNHLFSRPIHPFWSIMYQIWKGFEDERLRGRGNASVEKSWMGHSLDVPNAKTTDLTRHTLYLHPQVALPRQTLHGIIHPRPPEPRTVRNFPRQMRAHRRPRATIAVQPQDARQMLEVIVNPCVIKHPRSVFGLRNHGLVSRKKQEFRAGGSA